MQKGIVIPDVSQDLANINERLNQIQEAISELRQAKGEAWSVTQTALELDISRTHVTRLFYRGVLKGKQEGAGTRIYIYPESVKEYLRGKKEG